MSEDKPKFTRFQIGIEDETGEVKWTDIPGEALNSVSIEGYTPTAEELEAVNDILSVQFEMTIEGPLDELTRLYYEWLCYCQMVSEWLTSRFGYEMTVDDCASIGGDN